MTRILPFPSRGLARERGQCGRQHPTPAGELIPVVRLNCPLCDQEHALHNFRARDNRVCRPLDLADVRLRASQLGGEPFLGSPLPLPPRRQLQHPNSRDGADGYCSGLYFVNGHKHKAGAEYKQVAYIYTMHPGNRIRELRKAAGLSQAELAQRTGVSQPFISQIENQDGLSLDVARMRAIAREFGCTPADLLADGDNPDRLSIEEREIITRFRQATDPQREMIRRVAEPMLGFSAQAKNVA